jgi:hypothetical protein
MFKDFELPVEVSLQCINGDHNEPTAATLRCEPFTECTTEIRLKDPSDGGIVCFRNYADAPKKV